MMRIRPSYYILLSLVISMVASIIYFRSIEKRLDEKPLAATPVEDTPEEVDNVDQVETQAEVTAPTVVPSTQKSTVTVAPPRPQEAPAKSSAPRKVLNDAYLQRRLDSLPALPRRTVIVGKPIPFEITVPPGWKMLSWNNPITAVFNHRSIVTIETGPWVTSQDEFTNMTKHELIDRFPTMEFVGAENISIDGKTWQHLVMRGHASSAAEDHELSMLVYGSKRGSYRMLIEGDHTDLENDAREITLMLTSFRFPPDNFELEGTSDVRVYVDGQRVDF